MTRLMHRWIGEHGRLSRLLMAELGSHRSQRMASERAMRVNDGLLAAMGRNPDGTLSWPREATPSVDSNRSDRTGDH